MPKADQPWKAQFLRTVTRGKDTAIDMWIIRDDPDGDKIVTLGVPRGDRDTPYRIVRLMNGGRR